MVLLISLRKAAAILVLARLSSLGHIQILREKRTIKRDLLTNSKNSMRLYLIEMVILMPKEERVAIILSIPYWYMLG